jgi:hypothetical protein
MSRNFEGETGYVMLIGFCFNCYNWGWSKTYLTSWVCDNTEYDYPDPRDFHLFEETGGWL